jgi:hypothetical protein
MNYEWEIEYQRVCVREILSESMCVNERECGVFVLVLEGERARKIVCLFVKERHYERMSESAIE